MFNETATIALTHKLKLTVNCAVEHLLCSTKCSFLSRSLAIQTTALPIQHSA